MSIFKEFAEKFDARDKKTIVPIKEIQRIEQTLSIQLPEDYISFLTDVGPVWAPSILDIIVDNNLEQESLKQFLSIDDIIWDKQNEWTKHMKEDLIPFASDCSGNLFLFWGEHLRKRQLSAPVYFYDHDFDTTTTVSGSFSDWIEDYIFMQES